MKTFAIKTTLAACLLAPMMAMASDSGSESFSDTADRSVKLDGAGFTSVIASWSTKKGNATLETLANSLVWQLFNGKKLVDSGSFTDSPTDGNSGTIVLDESKFAQGKYEIVFTGSWTQTYPKFKSEVHLSEPVRSSVSPVPEPETYAMLLAGLALVATIAIRRKKSDAA